MRYGAMNFPVKPVLEEIRSFAAMGFDYVELSMDPPQAHYSILRRQRAEIAAALRQCGLGVVCHLPTFVLPADLTDSLRAASIEEMRHSLEVAAELGAGKAVLHPCPRSGMGLMVPDVVRGHALDFFAIMVEQAGTLGVTLCLENMFPRYGFGVEAAEFVEFFTLFPTLRMTLDVAHAHIDGGRDRRLRELLRALSGRIAHIHVSDNFGRRDDHLELGKGDIDLPAMARQLKAIGYDDTITLEVFDPDRQALAASRRRLQQLFSTLR